MQLLERREGLIDGPVQRLRLVVDADEQSGKFVRLRGLEKHAVHRLQCLRQIICQAGDWQTLGEPVAVFSDIADESAPDSADDLAALSVDFEVS